MDLASHLRRRLNVQTCHQGFVASIAGRIASNDGEMLVCENGSWVPFIKYNSNGDITGIGNSGCTADQIMKFDGTKFICADDNTGSGGGCAPACKADMSIIQIGDTCDDGSKFLGSHPTFVWQGFYVTDTNQSTLIHRATVAEYNSGAQSETDGQANQAWIVANRTLSQYPAFELCENLTRHGHSDWYLASRKELTVMYDNKDAIGGFTTYNTSSTEHNHLSAWSRNFDTGYEIPSSKSSRYAVRCVRRGSSVGGGGGNAPAVGGW